MKEKILALPLALKLIFGIIGLQALALAIWAVILVIVALKSHQVSIYASFAFGMFYFIVAGSLILALSGMIKRQGFSRALVIVWQLFAVIIGIQMYLAGAMIGLVAAAIGGTVIILMFVQPSLQYFEQGPEKRKLQNNQ